MSTEWTGDMIRIRRRDLGMSQDELARRAGMTQGYVSLLERSKAMSPDALGALAEVLGLEPQATPRRPPELSSLALAGPSIPKHRAAGARLHVDSWLRPQAGGDMILVIPAGPRSTLVFALDVAGHGVTKHAVTTWLSGWIRGRVAAAPGVPRVTDLWAGLRGELEEIDDDAAFFLAVLERWSDSHHIRYEALTDGYPPPLLLSGVRPRALESCAEPRPFGTGRSEPRTVVHGDLRPPWRLVIASDGLLFRTGGGVEAIGLRWIRRWQSGAQRDVSLEDRLSTPVAAIDDESAAVIWWDDWDFETPFDPTDYAVQSGIQAAIQGMVSRFSPEKQQAVAQAVTEVFSNVARYAGGRLAILRARQLDDGTVTIEVRDGGPGPSGIKEGEGLSLVRALCDSVDIHASRGRGTTVVLEMQFRGRDHAA
jgi:transcriptional regulator with XRE-family HTH domain/anti-sigma regulatory factor (Ser/Thr protein kinase)